MTASCQKAANNNSNGQTDNKAANSTPSPAPANAASPAPSVATNGESPIDAYKTAYTYRKNKDIEGLKKVLAKDAMEFMEMMGRSDKGKSKSLDDMLKELCERPQADTAEARNEKIDGDTASIEFLDENGKWQPMDFTKVDGKWKITFGKHEGGSTETNRSATGKDAKPQN